jgi:hypothetical protein
MTLPTNPNGHFGFKVGVTAGSQVHVNGFCQQKCDQQ